MATLSLLNDPDITLFNSLKDIESSSIGFFDKYFNQIEEFMKNDKSITLRLRATTRKYYQIMKQSKYEFPEAYELYMNLQSAGPEMSAKAQEKLSKKIEAILIKSARGNEINSQAIEIFQELENEPIKSHAKLLSEVMVAPLTDVLHSCERNTSDLEGTEKCVYFIIIAYTAFLFSQDQNMVKRFYNWFNTISTTYPSSPLIQLLGAIIRFSILPAAQELKSANVKARDSVYLSLYSSIKKEPEITLRVLWKNLELIEKNSDRENLMTELSIPFAGDIEIDRFKPVWISFNLSLTSFLIFYIQKLTKYDITHDLEQIQPSLERARSLDSRNPLAMLIYAFTLIEEENGLVAENLFKESIDKFGSYRIKIYPQLASEMKSLAYLGIATIYNKRIIYNEAEKYFNESLSYAQTEFLRCVLFLNRGKNRLDEGRMTDAISDFKETKKMPHTEALGLTNLGKLYYKQGLFRKSESVLLEAIDRDSSLQHAYYNLGVLYNDEDKKVEAEKLFTIAWNLDRNFKEAHDALIKLTQATKIEEKNFVIWWFKSPSIITKGLGMLFLGFIVYFMGQAIYITYYGKVVSNSTWIGLIVSIAFFLIPFLTKIKIGDVVELEMTSVTT